MGKRLPFIGRNMYGRTLLRDFGLLRVAKYPFPPYWSYLCRVEEGLFRTPRFRIRNSECFSRERLRPKEGTSFGSLSGFGVDHEIS